MLNFEGAGKPSVFGPHHEVVNCAESESTARGQAC